MTQETNSKNLPTRGSNDAEATGFMTSEEVLKELRTSPACYREFQEMRDDWQKAFMEFCMGSGLCPCSMIRSSK